MKEHVESLRKQLLQAAGQLENVIEDLERRPVFLMAPLSGVGRLHGQAIAEAASGLVAAVDDHSAQDVVHGAPRWSGAEFVQRAGQYPNAVAIDFSCSPGTRALIARLCAAAGVQRYDCVVAQGQLKRWAVYEAVGTYRRRTLERFDDFLRLADRFDDDLSRITLYANLLFRITYDRNHLLQAWSHMAGEYFSLYADNSTFRLGRHEHYVDCGAYQGNIVRKFLEATGYQYGSITAFEPDPVNFAQLASLGESLRLADFDPRNKAVSDAHGELKFVANGTEGSHISDKGGISVPTTMLDDELERLTFLKMDVEGFEPQTLQGASRLLRSCRPRIAAAAYHATHDLLKIVEQIDQHAGEDYHYRLRQHYGSYYYDLVLYASPVAGAGPESHAQ